MSTGISAATMHRSVYERFEAKDVVQYDARAPYRVPPGMWLEFARRDLQQLEII